MKCFLCNSDIGYVHLSTPVYDGSGKYDHEDIKVICRDHDLGWIMDAMTGAPVFCYEGCVPVAQGKAVTL